MRYGIENLITSTSGTLTSSVATTSGENVNKLLTADTHEAYRVTEGTTLVTWLFDTATVIHFIGLFNCVIEDDVVIKTYSAYPGTITNTKTINVLELTGLESKNTFFNLTDITAIEAITIETNGTTSSFQTSFGYLWAGLMVNIGCLEALQFADESFDKAGIDRAGGVDSQDSYKAQDYNVTINKKINQLAGLRTNMRYILNTGFATPRPWWFDVEPQFINHDEIILGIKDSGRFVYDTFITQIGEDPIAQTSFKIQEVL